MCPAGYGSASGYWEVATDGVLVWAQQGHRPDLPQVKVMLATLDPLGLPLVTQVVSGAKADDPLYIPAIDQVRTSVGRRGLLYVGDCKLMALATRPIWPQVAMIIWRLWR